MMSRKDLEARYKLFSRFALEDQRAYYQRTIQRYRMAANQVNRYRALFAFLTGFFAAFAGFLVQSAFVDGARCTVEPIPGDCGVLQFLVSFSIILSVATPAFGGFFSTLADLFQWDRMIEIYDGALENIEVADARSPLPDMDDLTYRASVRAYAEGTLQVMQDETTQWGQSVRSPEALDKFIKEEREKAAKLGGDADAPKDDVPG